MNAAYETLVTYDASLGDDVNVISTPGRDIAFVFPNRNPEFSRPKAPTSPKRPWTPTCTKIGSAS